MSTDTGGPAMPAGITTLIFDVLGTVVDEAGSLAAETSAALAALAGHRLRPWPDSPAALHALTGTT